MKSLFLFAFAAVAAGASADVIVYNNLANYTDFAYQPGGASAGRPITNMALDDIGFAAGSAGQSLTRFTFSVYNFGANAVAARPIVRFYAIGPTGGPGALLGRFDLAPVTVATGDPISTFSYPTGASAFAVPSNGRMYAGLAFDNVGTGATPADLNNLGLGIYDPAVVGSSADSFYQLPNTASYDGNGPVGTAFNFGGNPKASFGWSFAAALPVPEPASFAVLGLGLLALRRRRA